MVIRVWQTCFQLQCTICLEQATAISPISQQFQLIQVSLKNLSVCSSLISTVLLPPSDHLCLQFKPCAWLLCLLSSVCMCVCIYSMYVYVCVLGHTVVSFDHCCCSMDLAAVARPHLVTCSPLDCAATTQWSVVLTLHYTHQLVNDEVYLPQLPSIAVKRSLLPSMLWRGWLGGRKGIQPVKNRVMGCWCGCLSGARCRLAYGSADATVTHCLLLH